MSLVWLGIAAAVPALRAAGPRFEITLAASACSEPYTGRVYVMTTTHEGRRPMDGPGWFNPEPFYAQDVKDWKPGETLALDADKCLGFPGPLAEFPAGKRRVQAVIDLNRWSHDVLTAPGDAYSKAVAIDHDPADPQTVQLVIDQRVPEPKLQDTDKVKYVKLRSELLSKFYGRDVFLQAAVGLPASYAGEPERRYPAIYEIPGFGGNVRQAGMMLSMDLYGAAGLDIIRVALDPDCPQGHHVFADSANNGPWGTALVEELIPYLEREYRIIPDTDARYVTGGSSGGWSSLWLQVAYPDTFGGVWSLSPDPVDFSAFQRVNIYDPKDNCYVDADGSPQTVSRKTPEGQILFKEISATEKVLGRGGQMQSFEAAFGPRGDDGKPRKLWDRKTGAIDESVAQAWKKYDIALKLKREWPELGPKLKGKLHIIVGDEDTFWLDLAVYKLRDELKELGSDAEVEVVAGANHNLNWKVFTQVARSVAEYYRERAKTHGWE